MQGQAIEVISDLHIESHKEILRAIKEGKWPYPPPEAETLIIAGDIANSMPLAAKTCHAAASVYRDVFWIDGNHEHYSGGQDLNRLHQGLRALGQSPGVAPGHASRTVGLDENLLRFHQALRGLGKAPGTVHAPRTVGEAVRLRLEDTCILGLNAWYSLTAPGALVEQCKKWWEANLTDAKLINFAAGSVRNRNARGVRRVCKAQGDVLIREIQKEEALNASSRVCIVTHAPPDARFLRPPSYFQSPPESQGSFHNGLLKRVSEAVKGKINTWVYGHTHDPLEADTHHMGIRFIANPQGYGALERPAHYGPRKFLL